MDINMVSEILCTFASKRYAVFNGNTADALRALGAAPPKSVKLFSAEACARVCGVVEAVRRRIGGEDLSDVDAFLNWIYQKRVKPAAGQYGNKRSSNPGRRELVSIEQRLVERDAGGRSDLRASPRH